MRGNHVAMIQMGKNSKVLKTGDRVLSVARGCEVCISAICKCGKPEMAD